MNRKLSHTLSNCIKTTGHKNTLKKKKIIIKNKMRKRKVSIYIFFPGLAKVSDL